MSTIAALIFDVYQTLFPNSPDQWRETFRDLCRDQGLEMDSDVLWQEWRSRDLRFRQSRVNLKEPDQSPPFRTYFQSWRDTFRETFAVLGLKGDPEAAARRCVAEMGSRDPFDDALPTMEQLRGRWRLGLLSNADDAYLEPLLARHPLPVDAVLSSEMARAYKPHPRIFERMLTMLQVEPAQAVFVGDSVLDDIWGAQRLGLRTVWINRNGVTWDTDFPPPDYQIYGLTELLDVLENH